MSDDLKSLREALDKADEALLQALEKRMRLVEDVARAKKDAPETRFRDKDREKAVLARVDKQARDHGLNPYHVRRVFHQILEYSLDEQQRLLAHPEARDDAPSRRVGFKASREPTATSPRTSFSRRARLSARSSVTRRSPTR
ncbi:MAG: chorismate mutase [Deltaproteobacteria bacterium]|nr:chorismate mutase [Deltaproteobacteria bacterium]